MLVALAVNSLNAEEQHDRTATIKITHKLAKETIHGETGYQMSNAGIDFPVLLQRSLDGDANAIKLLFWASNNIGLDGAAADGYGYYLLKVAKKIGDAKLSRILSSLKEPETLETIKFYLLDSTGFNTPKEGAKEKSVTMVKKLLPKTWTLLNSTGEQDVDD